MSKPLVYALFIVLVTGCGLLIGINNIPGEWYQSLAKPAFNPPNWVFAPVWTALYVIIGFVGARCFLHHRSSAMMRLWVAQMIFNFAWSPLFFGLQRIALALIVILALLVSLIAFLGVSYRRDRASFLLFLPYLAWVAFATLLNLSIVLMN
ncbi:MULTISPECIES: TspO/MBR family protein [unclassified Rhizobium]|uniref:TspO/MBR family protein n=1 Tax=unclassified Rhizobium TaxID=2613769 RepID=UPI0006F97742|nr:MULTISPECIES: TspO/MBR family protein [unclassified Rhizobium]KQV44248.1 sensor histidine kinase [Rhizobium sp. Root1212]KRD38429.1 sensor histidine kinase [Rhizobium sp. Root268]